MTVSYVWLRLGVSGRPGELHPAAPGGTQVIAAALLGPILKGTHTQLNTHTWSSALISQVPTMESYPVEYACTRSSYPFYPEIRVCIW